VKRVRVETNTSETAMERMRAILPPTTTNANKQCILLGRILVAIGLCAMATVMWMTGRFGWSLHEAAVDRWASAALHVLNDAAGAGLVVASSVMLGMPGWSARIMGLVALLFALVLVTYSIMSVYGFMSTRISQLESHKSIVAYQQGEIDWKRKTIINRELPKADRQIMRAELRMASKEQREALRFIPDAQAASIAAWFDTTVERVQRALVIVTSGVGQLIKMACLFFGFSFLSYRPEGAPSSDDRSGAGGGDSQAGGGGGPRPAYPTRLDQVAVSGAAWAADRPPPANRPARRNVARAEEADRSLAAMEPAQAEVGTAQAEVSTAQAEVKPAQAGVRATQEVSAARAETTSAPQGGKFSRNQVNELLGLVVNGRLSLSTHAIARQTGWPRSTIRDMLARIAGIDAAIGKFARSRDLHRT
jgi:hypothetical protein